MTGTAKGRSLRVLVATDGSPGSRAALKTTTAFPWPRGTRAHAVVGRRDLVGAPGKTESGSSFWAGVDRAARLIGRAAQRQLATRWPDAEATVADQAAIAAILAAARRTGSDVIVVSSHGHGALGRLVLGSVSRAVVRQATGPVLVAKGRPRPIRRLMLGVDGSVQARRAVRFLCQLAPPPKARVTVVRVVEPVRVPSMPLAPAWVREAIMSEAAKQTAQRRRSAERDVQAAARQLARRGWRARPILRLGVPLAELLRAVAVDRSDALVLGARGHSGLARLLLGSVAEGALTRAPVPVLIVR